MASTESRPWFGRNSSQVVQETEALNARNAAHRKRLAVILRYIATMHHSAANNNNLGFVRECNSDAEAQRFVLSNYFSEADQDEHDDDDELGKVLFSTMDFAHLLSIMNANDGTALFQSPPFSFYAAGSSSGVAKRKRTLAGTIKQSITILASSGNRYQSNSSNDDRACWLRLTRLGSESPPPVATPAVRQYLENWKTRSQAPSIKSLLTLQNLSRAPKLSPETLKRQEIKSFLRRYKHYLQKKAVRAALEPMYNRLFEWLQQHQSGGHEELVWGFGNAKYFKNNIVVNGPLLEVLVEVELARDGALLVRPRQHTGVALNRQVVSQITQDGSHNSTELLATLYRTVSELETSQLSPGQPSTYTPLLKQMSMQLSSNGTFMSASEYNGSNNDTAHSLLVVTDAWCLSCRPKPSTVWARDASDLAEQLLLNKEGMDETLSKAAWALTHGSGALSQLEETATSQGQQHEISGVLQSIKSVLLGQNTSDASPPKAKPLFSLPTSDSQELIADLLLNRNFPAVVCEGPPGAGKTHTIANIVCAYLCQGKRVCVTSKGAPALAVLRQRLPACVQELCVDVSMSESTGMRQLQQTVERLSDRVSCVNTDVQTEKCRLLRENIDELEQELRDIDEQLESHSEDKRCFLTSPEGQELAETSLSLISSVPWLMQTINSWSLLEMRLFKKRVESLVIQQDKDPINVVTGYASPPYDALVSSVAAHAGETLSMIMKSALKTIASIPGLGSLSGEDQVQLQEALDMLLVDGSRPETRADWQLALSALRHDQAVHAFHTSVLDRLVTREGWPMEEIYIQNYEKRRINKNFLENVNKALRLKELAWNLDAAKEVKESIECGILDSRRTKIAARIQLLAENMVEQTVVAELRKSFSVEAQSALIKFAQVAGKSKFSKASQPSKMTQRQRRHRQEYLEAFEKCVRYTPCWVLTSSQISDYLPSESGLFDLVVIDEASQSDITVLPGMLRGKQWLIVGDGKQVSPSESFISEAQIDSLRAALPESPLADSLLPGHSFFDLCSQAFPTGRVVLSEHFRCAPDIIDFSNSQFYDGRLIPLRLPTKSERMTPCIVDVRVNGTKMGKVNEKECDTIVTMVQELVLESASRASPRSIGIISLIGDEQSRLIRGRLLDAIGPQKYKEHNILIGDPPTFQGAEKDVVFLSLVCSAGRVPTQNQQMHAQRANVALSRARDRMVLVRSIDSGHVPNRDDVKIPIIEFFESATEEENGVQIEQLYDAPQGYRTQEPSIFSFRIQTEALLEKLLVDGGYTVRRMGVVWNDAICVENGESASRAAVCIDCAGEPKEEWKRVMTQQKSIERVGWRCLRVDALSFLSDFQGTFKFVKEFLTTVGVEPTAVEAVDNIMLGDDELSNDGDGREDENMEDPPVEEFPAGNVLDSAAVVVISSDDEEAGDGTRNIGQRQSEMSETAEVKVENDGFDPEQFGDVVDLGFLRSQSDARPALALDGSENASAPRSRGGAHGNRAETSDAIDLSSDDSDNEGTRKCTGSQSSDEDEAYLGESESGDITTTSGQRSRRKGRKYRRLDSYSRDGRWYPGQRHADDEDVPGDTWYDTDSDLAPEPVVSSEGNEASFSSQGKTPQE